MPTNNEFRYRGALGGLVASDERIREQTGKEMDNQIKALDKMAKVMELDLSRKYADRKAAANTREAEAKAELGESQANVHKQTAPSTISQAASDAATAATEAQYAEQRQKAAIEANEASTLNSRTQAQATAVLTPWRVDALKAQAAAARSNANTSAARLNIEDKLADSLVAHRRGQASQAANELTQRQALINARVQMLTAQAEAEPQNLQIRQQIAELQKVDLSIKQQRVQIEKERLEVHRQEAAYRNLFNLMKSTGGTAGGPGTGATGAALDTAIGIFNDGQVVGDIVQELHLLKPDAELLDDTGAPTPGKGTFVGSQVGTMIDVYRQLVSQGRMARLPRGDLNGVLLDAMEATSFAGGGELKIHPSDAGYRTWWSARMGALKRSGYSAEAIRELGQIATEADMPMHPAFAFLWATQVHEDVGRAGAAQFDKRSPKK